MVDTLLGWAGASPPMIETEEVVCSHPMNDILHRFGLPRSIQSDNGPTFISKGIQLVPRVLGAQWHLRIPYHPLVLGKVERANGHVKTRRSKLSSELHLLGLNSYLSPPSRSSHTLSPCLHQPLRVDPRPSFSSRTLTSSGTNPTVLIGVPIAVRRHRDHGSAYKESI